MSNVCDNLSAVNTEYMFENEPDNKKTYFCQYPQCGKCFRFKSEIMRHMSTHTNNRPYVCPYNDCGKSFKRADALENHLRIHTRETPFICEYEGCGMGFTTKASLRYHILKHKDEKIYKCSYPGCNKAFITLFQLKQHEKSVSVHKKLTTNKTEGSYYEQSSESTSSFDASEAFIYSSAQPQKKVEPEPSIQFSSSFLFEDPTQQIDAKYERILKENEMLRQRLELSEKLLLTVLQQKMNTTDSGSLYNQQDSHSQAPDMFRESASYPFSSSLFASIDN